MFRVFWALGLKDILAFLVICFHARGFDMCPPKLIDGELKVHGTWNRLGFIAVFTDRASP